MKINRLLSYLVFVIFIFSFVNCKKSEDSAPTMPGTNTINMDLSFLSSLKSASIVDDSSNYREAKYLVSFWDGEISEYSTLPKIAYAKASSTSATQKYKGYWIWAYSFMIGNSNYLGELNAIDTTTTRDSVIWNLTITQVETSDVLKYITGKSASDMSGGWWNIYYPDPENFSSKPFLHIEWKKEKESITRLRNTNIMTDDENTGSYIEFNKLSDLLLDRNYTMEINNYPNNTSLNDKTILIQWNNTAKNGNISINDVVEGCWDTTLKNKSDCN